jgi:hypothetical protein
MVVLAILISGGACLLARKLKWQPALIGARVALISCMAAGLLGLFDRFYF